MAQTNKPCSLSFARLSRRQSNSIAKMADRVVSISDGRVVGVHTNAVKVDVNQLEW